MHDFVIHINELAVTKAEKNNQTKHFMTDQQDNEKKSFMKKNPWIIIPGILIMGYLVFTQLSDMTAKKKEKDNQNSSFYS